VTFAVMPDVNSALPIYSGGRRIMRANCNIAARSCRLIPSEEWPERAEQGDVIRLQESRE
jgi:hypothetical protein